MRERDGRPTLRHFSNAQWLAELPSGTAQQYEAFVGEPTALVAGDLAVVFGSYAFTIDGERSHGGVDALHLLRTAEGWRIAGGADTVIGPARQAAAAGARGRRDG